MRIQITYAEINNHFFETNIMNDVNFSEILVEYIQENYFNGMDSAVIYLGKNPEFEYVELDLIPN